jgi:hypothetical protein
MEERKASACARHSSGMKTLALLLLAVWQVFHPFPPAMVRVEQDQTLQYAHPVRFHPRM